MPERQGEEQEQKHYKPSNQRPVGRGFTEPMRERFLKLLTLAAESPFAGERRNALDAARRLARRYGLSLEEAAAGGAAPPEPLPPQDTKKPEAADNLGRFWRQSDTWQQTDRQRFEEAVAAARARGLDADEAKPRPPRRHSAKRFNSRRREPVSHATALLIETTIPFAEIATITGLDIYQVVALKLKLRKAA